MTKIRIFIFLLTLLVVGTIGTFAVAYARGYRFDWSSFRFIPKGLLVIKSDPTGAQIFIDGDLNTATDATISISPGTYDVSVRKDGYLAWNKRLTIEKEVVTVATVNLFRSAPSLTAVTFDGALNPVASDDFSKILFAVAPSLEAGTNNKAGLWVIDTTDLPLGFSKDPRQITDGDVTQDTWQFSPDSRQVMLTTKSGVYLLDAGSFTPQSQRVNVASGKEAIITGWQAEKEKKLSAQIKSLPDEVVDVISRKTSQVAFSPNETKILYTASGSATLSDSLIKQLPGSSTQRQKRDIETGKTYIYDIKEDRNFLIADEGATVRWFPTSRHLIQAEEGRIVILDYDGTNRQAVYTGSYVDPYAYPYVNSSRLLVLTNLGAGSAPTNLYSLSLK